MLCVGASASRCAAVRAVGVGASASHRSTHIAGTGTATSRRAVFGAAGMTVVCAALDIPPVHAIIPRGERESVTDLLLPVGKDKSVSLKRRRYTGAGDPEWTYPVTDYSDRLYASWPDQYPYKPEDFKRVDEEADTTFYAQPKLVYHIDEGAVSSLMRYYDRTIRDGSDILDICSSWVSHYPPDFPERMKSITGTGISDKELACNDQLSRALQQDLNKNAKFPFRDNSFDAVTCVVSFDYLTKPLEVMKEIQRVLRPGGSVILSQSNRCFFTKAVAVWTSDMRDASHLQVLGNYIHFAGGFDEPCALDISPRGPGTNDPSTPPSRAAAANALRHCTRSRNHSIVPIPDRLTSRVLLGTRAVYIVTAKKQKGPQA